jgi:hypothetical protein
MNKTLYRLIAPVAGVAVVLLVAGCVRPGKTETYSRSVELGGASSARVDLQMGVGELNLTGGSSNLLDADFIYNIAGWKPDVTYKVTEGKGLLTVRQPDSGSRFLVDDTNDVRYEWDLKLNDSVPMDLNVKLGVGTSNVDLHTLSLKTLDLNVGVGDSTIDLTGTPRTDVDAKIKGGVGKATIKLPSQVGVRVAAKGGLGNIDTRGLTKDGSYYVNDAYGKSDVTVDITVEGGIGDINLEVED